ncbi:DUF2029 domain-containing protein, partial [bacterium]|nr:DUF2029 domain-containing protein [bacterium]
GGGAPSLSAGYPAEGCPAENGSASLDGPARGEAPCRFPSRCLPAGGRTRGRALAAFPPRDAYRIWIVVLEALLAALVCMFLRRTEACRLRWFIAGVLLLSSPYFLEVHMGQFTFAATALLAMGVLRRDHPRDRRATPRDEVFATATYALAALLKVFPLVTAPALLRERRLRRTLLVTGGVVLAASLPYFAAHPEGWDAFRRANLSSLAGGMDSGNHGLVYVIRQVAQDAGWAWLVERWNGFMSVWHASVVIGTTIVVWLSRRGGLGVAAAAMLLAHLVGYGHVWEHHLSGGVVAGVLALHAVAHPAAGRPDHRIAGWLIAALVLLALPTPFALFDTALNVTVWDPSAGWPAWQRYALPLAKVVPTLLLYVVCLAWLMRPGPRRDAPSRRTADMPVPG